MKTNSVSPFYTPFKPPPAVKLVYNELLGKTKQEFRDECDINVIVTNFVRHGALNPRDINSRTAMYEDVCDVGDLKECFDKVDRAVAGFSALSSEIRDRFHNSPMELLAWVSDPSNEAEAIELGLLLGVAPVKGPAVPPAPRVGDDAVK